MILEDRVSRLTELLQQAGLDENDPRDRLLAELTETVSLLCRQLASVSAVADGVNESVDEIQKVLESFLEEVSDDEEPYDDGELPYYEVSCPVCGAQLTVDEESLIKGFSCPECGAQLMQAD